MYQRYLANVNQLEDQFAALWTQCQRCQVPTAMLLMSHRPAEQAATYECAMSGQEALPVHYYFLGT